VLVTGATACVAVDTTGTSALVTGAGVPVTVVAAGAWDVVTGAAALVAVEAAGETVLVTGAAAAGVEADGAVAGALAVTFWTTGVAAWASVELAA
jgi:hypothetical protein